MAAFTDGRARRGSLPHDHQGVQHEAADDDRGGDERLVDQQQRGGDVVRPEPRRRPGARRRPMMAKATTTWTGLTSRRRRGRPRWRTWPRTGHLGPPARRGSRAPHAAVVDHRDAIGPHGGGEAVGDDDRGASLQHHVESLLDPCSTEVEVRGRLVEHEHPGRARKARPSAATGARPTTATTALVDDRVETVWQSSHQLVEADQADRLLDLGSVASGSAKVRLARTVSLKRKGSWGTTPSWRRSDSMVTSRRSWPSRSTRPAAGS